MTGLFGSFFRDERGATAIEYGLVAAFIAIVVLVSFALLGDPLEGLFSGVAGEFTEINERL
jgi:pilus assembly protein Flp/PilA